MFALHTDEESDKQDKGKWIIFVGSRSERVKKGVHRNICKKYSFILYFPYRAWYTIQSIRPTFYAPKFQSDKWKIFSYFTREFENFIYVWVEKTIINYNTLLQGFILSRCRCVCKGERAETGSAIAQLPVMKTVNAHFYLFWSTAVFCTVMLDRMRISLDMQQQRQFHFTNRCKQSARFTTNTTHWNTQKHSPPACSK